MHAPFDRSRNSGYTARDNSGRRFLIFPVIVAVALLTLAAIHPKASIWISQAVQAEFGGSGFADDMPVETMQQPDMTVPMQTVRAN